ncbi:hypothetical protein [Pseudoalteromonas sp. CF6-2]|nr:hypothetical protein [Lelliottia steviae]UJX24315.1 hypothetical protein L3Q70_09740 [Pseudoalteromonas sp. CF6-2]
MKYLILILLASSSLCWAKRPGSERVFPVEYEGVKYEAVPWALENGTTQNGGFVRAVEVESGEVIWAKQIYKTKYKRGLERDVQDVFIVKLEVESTTGIIKIENEVGMQYRVKLSNGSEVK